MRKRLRKKLGIGEFKHFYFQATLCLRSCNDWARFTEAMIDFISNRWRRWAFGDNNASHKRPFIIDIGFRDEADLRREEMIHWLGGRDNVQLVEVGSVYKS